MCTSGQKPLDVGRNFIGDSQRSRQTWLLFTVLVFHVFKSIVQQCSSLSKSDRSAIYVLMRGRRSSTRRRIAQQTHSSIKKMCQK
ncbi:hypothetical protein CPB86DRAFT_292514 [Serendipita vermifera]|nr:hypothetical protein CPB86DRAFT_292514 [Serendipita vermifera]